MTRAIRPTRADIEWLGIAYPSLRYAEERQHVVGELDFRACYDAEVGKLRMEGRGLDERIRNATNYIQDVFEIEMRLGPASVGPSGWPTVYDVGGRIPAIAEKWNVPKIDLHVYEDESFCLGLTCSRSRQPSLRWLIENLVVPFLYRLAYVDRFGVEAARRDLWGEYSHGPAGPDEYGQEMSAYARRPVGRNDLCPCGSGKKAKKCCLDEIQEWRKRAGREAGPRVSTPFE